MQYSRVQGFIGLILTIVILALSPALHASDKSDTQPFSIIYSFTNENGRDIYLSDADGKNRLKIVDATPSDGYPAMSPSGKQFAFYGKYDDYKTWSIHTANIDGTNVRRLTFVKNVWDSAPTWSQDGKTIMFAREYKDADGDWHEEIWLMDPDGTNKRQIKPLKGRSPEFLPDGRIMFQSKASPSQISIADLDGSNMIQLTDDGTNNMSPKISPDGKRIAYLSNRDKNQEVYLMDIDGSNQKRLTKNGIKEWDPAWSADGSKIFFSSQNVHGGYDVFKVNPDGSSIEKVLSSGSQTATVRSIAPEYIKKLNSAEPQ